MGDPPQDTAEESPNVTLRFTHGVADDAQPIADTRYTAVVGERVYRHETNGNGEMQVYVPERLYEIGLRKSIGARDRDILAQFMIDRHTGAMRPEDMMQPKSMEK